MRERERERERESKREREREKMGPRGKKVEGEIEKGKLGDV